MADRSPIRVELLPDPDAEPISASGPVRCLQSAVMTVDEATLEVLWRPASLEVLARSYWEFLRRRTLGLIRVDYRADSRTVTLLTPRLPLLTFRAPEYETGPGFGRVTWPIDRGLLVASSGRGTGHLRIEARLSEADEGAAGDGRCEMVITSDVANFYPLLRGHGAFSRFGKRLYALTQLKVHMWMTRGFLRSLEQVASAQLLDRKAHGLGEPRPLD